MDTIAQLFTELKALNVKLWIEDDHLCYKAPKGALTPTLRTLLRDHKTEIKDLLYQANLHDRCLDTDWEDISQESEENPVSLVTAANLAYVIYTSGSTGQPKGVAVPHQQILNRLAWMWDAYPFQAGEVGCSKTAINFVDSIWELLGPLLQGVPTVIIPNSVIQKPFKFVQILAEHQVTRLWVVPSFLRAILDTVPNLQSQLPNLKFWVTSGEAISVELLQRFQTSLPQAVLYNLYGTSEVWDVTWYEPDPQPQKLDRVPIGRPIANMQAYILDAHLQPVPVGVQGELYVGGVGLAREYINRPELTAEKFISNPFNNSQGDRLYKTGDLARYLPDGNIEFLGRIDTQVKIRGFRIELGEVEAALSQHSAIGQTVVIARDDISEDKRLVAYLVLSQDQAMTVDELRRFLQQKLPNYMVPSAFVFLDALPLTPNGKIDRRALPAPDQTRLEQEGTFVAPRDELELQLTKIWEKVLGIQPIGIHDNFFDLGGHSLLAVKLFAEINKAFDKNLSVVTLFQAPTIEQVARFLSQEKSAESWRSLVPLQPKGYKPPLFLIHPCNGEIFIYRLLAQHLGLERPVYGLQAIGLNGKQTPDNRVEKMASHYIKEIQTVQPNGPYFLGGKQIGACVAFEMAQQLVSQGQQVKIVVLFDTRLSPHSFSEKASRLLGNYLSLGPSYILKAAKGKIRAQISMRIKSPILRLKAVIHKFFLSSESQTSEKLSQNIQSIDIRDSLGQAVRNYAPKVYPGRGVLFQPIETNQGEVQGVDKESKMGWGKLFAGGLETHYLPDGNSNTIYTEPYVRILAEKISICLEEVDQLIPEKRREPESSVLVPIQPNGSKSEKQAQKTEIISSEKWLEPGSSLVPIQPNGSKPPLFCIHPASIALYYRNLVQYLDSEQPFYVLQLDVGHKKQMPYSQSIEDLAAHYITEMRTVQPNGPYFLSGNCWGGLVAFEVAQQLHSQGQQVALLLLFDSYAPGAIKRLPFRERLSEHLDNLLQLRLDYLLTKVIGKAKQVKNSLQKKGQKTIFKLYQLIGYPLPSSLRDLPRLDAIEPATKNYTPQVYPGKVTVFHVQKLSPQGWSVDSQLGWGDLASQGVELHQIPGTHDSMFQEPHVKVLAKKLKIYLDVESQA